MARIGSEQELIERLPLKERLDAVISLDGSPLDVLVAVGQVDVRRAFRNQSLRKVSFRNRKIVGYDFSGADLREADFRGTRFVDCVFEGAILTDVHIDALTDGGTAQGRFLEAGLTALRSLWRYPDQQWLRGPPPGEIGTTLAELLLITGSEMEAEDVIRQIVEMELQVPVAAWRLFQPNIRQATLMSLVRLWVRHNVGLHGFDNALIAVFQRRGANRIAVSATRQAMRSGGRLGSDLLNVAVRSGLHSEVHRWLRDHFSAHHIPTLALLISESIEIDSTLVESATRSVLETRDEGIVAVLLDLSGRRRNAESQDGLTYLRQVCNEAMRWCEAAGDSVYVDLVVRSMYRFIYVEYPSRYKVSKSAAAYVSAVFQWMFPMSIYRPPKSFKEVERLESSPFRVSGYGASDL